MLQTAVIDNVAIHEPKEKTIGKRSIILKKAK